MSPRLLVLWRGHLCNSHPTFPAWPSQVPCTLSPASCLGGTSSSFSIRYYSPLILSSGLLPPVPSRKPSQILLYLFRWQQMPLCCLQKSPVRVSIPHSYHIIIYLTFLHNECALQCDPQCLACRRWLLFTEWTNDEENEDEGAKMSPVSWNTSTEAQSGVESSLGVGQTRGRRLRLWSTTKPERNPSKAELPDLGYPTNLPKSPQTHTQWMCYSPFKPKKPSLMYKMDVSYIYLTKLKMVATFKSLHTF